MRVESVRYDREGVVHVVVDGRRLMAEPKYTLLEMGYAVLNPEDDESRYWCASVTESIPPDLEDGRSALVGNAHMLVTSDPVVVAVVYEFWWARNSEGYKPARHVRIPSREEALRIVRSRRILNEHNRKYAGRLPNGRGWE